MERNFDTEMWLFDLNEYSAGRKKEREEMRRNFVNLSTRELLQKERNEKVRNENSCQIDRNEMKFRKECWIQEKLR